MMEKLLHERLREIEDDIGDIKVYGEDVTFFRWDAQALADEIERYYIPRPRFEDGEPVQFGDATTMQDNIEAMLFKANGSFETHQKFKNKCGTSVAIYGPNEPVKRPTQKVYDADGVPCKRGETIYGIETGDAFEVLNPNLREGYMEAYYIPRPHFEDGEPARTGEPARELQGKRKICEIKPEFYTHERPVFDAEGERICNGDTVWHVRTGQKATVTTVYRDDQTVVEVKIAGHLMDYEPSDLTHREPDSQKLIDADSELSGMAYCRKHNLTPHKSSAGKSTKYKHLFKRQRALIERDA